MNGFSRNVSAAVLCGISLLLTACAPPQPQAPPAAAPPAQSNANVASAPPAAAPVAPDPQMAANLPVTLPVMDAMFADEAFAAELKTKLGLTDEQIENLRNASREAVANLDEASEGSTTAATRRAEEQLRAVVGEQKAGELINLIRQRWNEGAAAGAATAQAPGSVPSDTRVVVNAPAYRMDLFKDGQLVRSYKVGIGYPEFPLPTGQRTAKEIIFNPTWTPPDEPWVKGKVKPGQKVEAGSKLNPLGPIKIPIGLPSLIHGGKDAARLGGFASHGCVGLTNPQVQDFTLALAQISGTEITPEDVANYEKQKTETKNVKLAAAIPVELRYETIVVEDGKLRIYRDVYERGTNTEENVRRVLEAYGVSLDSLSEAEKTKVMNGLQQMARDAQGNPTDGMTNANANSNSNAAATAGGAANAKNQSNNAAANASGKVTRTIKGQKEVVIEIAALKGKGYPAPVDLNTGGKSKTPLKIGTANADPNAKKPAAAAANSQSKRF